METIRCYVYSLYRNQMEVDYCDVDEPLVNRKVLVDRKIVNDCSDNICIGGYGVDHNYYQFDSYEAYHASGFFSEKQHIHGLFVESKEVEVSVNLD